MKTTLNIDDTVMADLKREAARQGRTMSELVETALRLLLAPQRKRARLPALPRFRSDFSAIRRDFLTPGGGLPVFLCIFAVVGMLWAPVPWIDRFAGLGGFYTPSNPNNPCALSPQ
jgi:hypothetical protein